jgi:hypothetical protein
MGASSLVKWLEKSGCSPIVVGSHPRSGTHLVIDTLRHNFPECRSWKFWGERSDRLYLNLASLFWNQHPLSEKTAIRILSRVRCPIIKTHSFAGLGRDIADGHRMRPTDPELLAWLREHASFVYSYRDGREVLCSWHEMSAGSDLAAHVPFSEFIRQHVYGVSRVKNWALHVQGWLEEPTVNYVRMEDLLVQPTKTLGALARKLGLRLDPNACQLPRRTASHFEHRLKRLFTAKPQSTALISRKQRPGWREVFAPEDCRFFYEESNGMLIQLGYEDSTDWIEDHRRAVSPPPSEANPRMRIVG